jgi:hypothetical protein
MIVNLAAAEAFESALTIVGHPAPPRPTRWAPSSALARTGLLPLLIELANEKNTDRKLVVFEIEMSDAV